MSLMTFAVDRTTNVAM